MKKILIFMMTLVMLLTLFSCGKNTKTDETVTFDYDSALTETGVDLDIGSVIID